MLNSNPYVSQIMEQTGMTSREVFASAAPMRPMTFPCVIHGRTFETQNEYLNAMHDYLDSM